MHKQTNNQANAVKILILGGGQVGANVAENLLSENNDITVVDQNAARLKQLQDRLDIRTVAGNAAHPQVLADAGAADSDMVLALTRDDETNLVACKMAEACFNIPTRIARIRSSDYLESEHGDPLAHFGIESAICPEQIVTDHIYQLFAYPGALQVLDFADGKLQLVVSRAHSGGKLLGMPLRHIREHMPDADCRVCAVHRRDTLLVPDGDTVLEEGDEVFFVAAREHVQAMLKELRFSERPLRRIMIAGGGNIGYRLAKLLENDFSVKVIEARPERAQWLAERLEHALVLRGEATDEELLDAENVDEMDVFCALTNDDEDNIMSTLLAKRMGARRVVALVNRTSYVDLLEGHRIDIVISPHLSTIGSILAHIRQGDVEAVHPLRRGASEAMEVIIHGDAQQSRLTGRRIDQIDMPHGSHIVAAIRGEQVLMAHHDLTVENGDHLIIFLSRRRVIRQVEKLIQVKLGFL
nr:Trk system potassium transporter TrkA [Chromobacterium haemolyticum]